MNAIIAAFLVLAGLLVMRSAEAFSPKETVLYLMMAAWAVYFALELREKPS